MEVSRFPQWQRYGKEVVAAQMRHGVLRLPHGFLGLPVPPLWFHPNYSLAESFIERQLKNNLQMEVEMGGSDPEDIEQVVIEKRQFHLVGTPGIGKSYFGHYWFYKQAKQGKRVIWRTTGDSAMFLYYDFALEEPFVQVSTVHVMPQEWVGDEHIWLIVDGRCGGLYHHGPVLHCVSAGSDGYHEFSKDLGIVFYLEAWSLEELKECRRALGLPFSDAALEERFFYCGGVPREIFNWTKTPDKLKQLMQEAATRAPSWEAIIRHAASEGEQNCLLHCRLPSEPDLNAEASDRLLHCKLTFGSEFIAGHVFELHQQQGFRKAREFCDFCQGIPRAHDLAGKFFEKFVHKKLQEGGGEYRVKPLGQGLEAFEQPAETSIITLRPSSAQKLRRWTLTGAGQRPKRSKKEVVASQFSVYVAHLGNEEAVGLASLQAGCFITPYSATFKSLDSLVTPNTMIQYTYSMDHKLFWALVLEIVQEFDLWHSSKKLPVPDYYQLLFVVPESQFWDFRFQWYKKDDGSEYKEMQPQMERVRQLALAFAWS